MQLYLGTNGIKTGPFSVWDVRTRLEKGELAPDTLGWHEGCTEWLPLRDLPGLGWQHTPESPALPGDEDFDPDKLVMHAAVAAGVRVRPWARWWARFFDLTLWLLVAAVATRPFHYGFDQFLIDPWAQLISTFLYLLAESVLLVTTGTTPGKFLLGLRVARPGGQGLPFAMALKRSFMVYVLGNALYLIICPIPWVVHFVSLAKHGSTWWDRQLRTEVVSTPPNRFGILPFVCAFLALQVCLNLLVGPEVRSLVEQVWPGSGPPSP